MENSNINIHPRIIEQLINTALNSGNRTMMAAVPMRNNKMNGIPYCNRQNRIYEDGEIIPNCGHAEREALCRNNLISFKIKNGKRKRKKARGSMNTTPNAILVIRISPDDSNTLLNARPCRSCLENMKKCGIKKVYYSANNQIYMENISNMISIKDSIFSRKIFQNHHNYPTNFRDYLKYSLRIIDNIVTDIYHLNLFIELCIDTYDYDITYIIKKKNNKKTCKIIMDDEILCTIHII